MRRFFRLFSWICAAIGWLLLVSVTVAAGDWISLGILLLLTAAIALVFTEGVIG